MHSRTIAVGLITIGLTISFSADPAAALQDNPVHTHIGHVVTGFGRTPDGAGLLPTAMAEAQTAIQHVDLAWRDPSNLDWMQTHAAHVLNAVDPSQVGEGPGLGFGVLPAAEGIAQHIELAAGSDGASDAVRTHAAHVAEAARAVRGRTAEIAALAVRVASASDYTSGEGLIAQIRRLANELITGADGNGDGQIGWGNGEGGLQHVEQHLGLLMAAEGL
jgi:hypothetical protein